LTWNKSTYTLTYQYPSAAGTFTLGAGATLTNGSGTTYNSILAVEATAASYFGALVSSASNSAPGLAVGNRGGGGPSGANAADFYRTRGGVTSYGANAYRTTVNIATDGNAIVGQYFNDAGSYAVTQVYGASSLVGLEAHSLVTNSTNPLTIGQLAVQVGSNKGIGVLGNYYPPTYPAYQAGVGFSGGVYDGGTNSHNGYYGAESVAFNSSGYVFSLTYTGCADMAGDFMYFNPAAAGNINLSAQINLATQAGYGSYITVGTHYPFTGSHEVLTAPNQGLEIGDIVVCTDTIAKKDINNAMVMVVRSSAPNQKSVLGVVSLLNIDKSKTLPTSLTTYIANTSTSTTATPIAILDPQYQAVYDANELTGINAIGEGLINVCGEGGNIEIGDYITSSSTPGKGMKQADDLLHNYTVAKAREAYTFTGNEIVQIACTYHCG
jgi:hypothetical protein